MIEKTKNTIELESIVSKIFEMDHRKNGVKFFRGVVKGSNNIPNLK
jgi:hypothetical protein